MASPAPCVDRSHPAPRPTLIGVRVDGGRSSRDAVALASVIGQATRGELMLIAVHEEALVSIRDALAPQAKVVLEPDALVWRALRRVARQEHLDLLVVGAGGAHAAADGLECALAIAPLRMRMRKQPQLREIGVGFDDTEESWAALETAAALARAAGTELAVLGAAREELMSERARSLDLLVIGSSRSGPAGRVFLGSTGSALVDGAGPAVLIVPRPPQEPSEERLHVSTKPTAQSRKTHDDGSPQAARGS